MSLQAPKTVTEVFTAQGLTSGQVCVLLQCQELALAVTLQGKYEVGFDTSKYGIHCSTRLAGTTPTHESFCVIRSDLDLADIHQVVTHLLDLLADSATDEERDQ